MFEPPLHACFYALLKAFSSWNIFEISVEFYVSTYLCLDPKSPSNFEAKGFLEICSHESIQRQEWLEFTETPGRKAQWNLQLTGFWAADG